MRAQPGRSGDNTVWASGPHEEGQAGALNNSPSSPEPEFRRWLVGSWRSTGGTNRLILRADLRWTWTSTYEGSWTASGSGNIQGGVVTLTGRREGTTERGHSAPSYPIAIQLRREGEMLTGEIQTIKKSPIKYVREA